MRRSSVGRAAYLVFGAILAGAGAISCGRGGDTSVTAQCQRLRDHFVEIELSPDSPDRDVRAGVMRRALGNEFVTTCARSMTETQRDCVLSASDSRTALACSSRSAR